MCNLYSHTKGPKAIRGVTRAMGVVCILMMLGDAALANGAPNVDGKGSAILDKISKIEIEKDLGARIRLGQELNYLVMDTKPQDISDTEIRGLIRLLNDKDDGVRMWAANSLTHVGARAKGAVPDLKRAYQKIACFNYEVSSKPIIEMALEGLHEGVPRVRCPKG